MEPIGFGAMMSQARLVIRLMVVLTLAQAVVVADAFVPPNDGPVPFRRDRVPLEAGAMTGLSKSLGVLARGLKPKTAAERRGAAQMVALALALNPGDQETREIISQYRKGGGGLRAEAGELVKARARVWRTIGWLESPVAGEDGHALAVCLKDVVVRSDPKDRRVEALGSRGDAGEAGAWEGWIPPVSAYEKKVARKQKEPKEPKVREKEPVREVAKVRLQNAAVEVPLWRLRVKVIDDGLLNHTTEGLLAETLKMRVAKSVPGADGRFGVDVGETVGSGTFRTVEDKVQKLLVSRHGKLPQDVRVKIESLKARRPTRTSGVSQSVSGAVALLADSAFSGVAPTGYVIGNVDSAGGFSLPNDFWLRVRALDEGGGGRLVVPAAAAQYFPSLLAMEKPEFFLKYQVLLAEDFDGLVKLSAKVPEEPLAAVVAAFEEIQERSKGQDAGQYIANRFVRQRLADVLRDAPNHLSARMLLLQGTSDRPTKIDREVLAVELGRCLDPLDWVMELHSGRVNSDVKVTSHKYAEEYDACREALRVLEWVVATDDRDLFEMVEGMMDTVRTFERAMRSTTSGNSARVAKAVEALVEMKAYHRAVMTSLRTGKAVVPAGDGR